MRNTSFIPVIGLFGLIAISSSWNRELPTLGSYATTQRVAASGARLPASASTSGDKLATPVTRLVSAKFLPSLGEQWKFDFSRDAETTLNGSPAFSFALRGLFTIERQFFPARSFLVQIESRETEPALSIVASLVIQDDLKISPILKLLKGELPEAEQRELGALARDVVQAYLFSGPENALGSVELEIQSAKDGATKRVLSVNDPGWKVVASAHEITLSEERLERSVGRDHFLRMDGGIATHQELSYQFRFDSSHASRAWRPNEKTAAVFSEIDLAKSPAFAADANFPESKATDWTALIAEVARGNTLSGMRRLGLVRDLARGLREDATRVRELREWIRSQKDPRAWRLVTGALLEAANPAAEHALIDLFESPDSPAPVPALILGAFTVAQRPLQRSTVEWLAALPSPALGDERLLALGSAHRYQKETTERALVQNAIRQSFDHAGAPNEKIAALDAAGNSGAVEFLPLIRRELTADDARVREHAVLALRLQTAEEVGSLLEKIGRLDPVESVRLAARTAQRMRDEQRDQDESL